MSKDGRSRVVLLFKAFYISSKVQRKKAEGRFHSDTKETVPPSGQEEKHTGTDSKQLSQTHPE